MLGLWKLGQIYQKSKKWINKILFVVIIFKYLNFVLPLSPFFYLLTFFLLQAQVPSHWVCHPPFMSCFFSGLMELLNWTIQSSIYIPPSNPPRHAPSTTRTGPARFWFWQPSDRSWLTRACAWFFRTLARIIRQPSSNGVLCAFMFSLCFPVFFSIFSIFCSLGLLGWKWE